MKQLKKLNLSIALQIVAVLIIFLFGYPGCSSNSQSKEKTINTKIPVISTALSSTLK